MDMREASRYSAKRGSAPVVVHVTSVHRYTDPRIFEKQIKSAAQAGFDLRYIARYPEDTIMEAIELLAIPDDDPLGLRSSLWRLGAMRKVLFKALRVDGDIYHLHDPELLPLGWVLKKVIGATIVYDMHENNFGCSRPSRRLLALIEQWGFRWVDHVVLAEAAYESLLPSTTPRTPILNYPIASAGFSEVRKSEPFTLLYSGYIAGERGLFRLLDILRIARASGFDWKLKLVGTVNRPGERQRAESIIAAHDLEEHVERFGWTRFVPHDELMAACKGCHVAVVLLDGTPNSAYSIPTKFYEYLELGIPILCSDLPRWRAFIEVHGCGAVVPPEDAQLAFETIAHWQKRPRTLDAMGSAGFAAAPLYQWREMAEQLTELYHDLLSE